MVGRRTVAIGVVFGLLVLGAAIYGVGRVTYADVQQTVNQAWGALPSTLVTRVIDGVTIELVDGSSLRYIGVAAPQCRAAEAKSYNASMVEGKTVVLEYDSAKTDGAGHELAYVWLDGQLVNEQLVAVGWATTNRVEPNTRYADRLATAEKVARAKGAGIWAPHACDD